MSEILPFIVGGLVLFLYAISKLSEVLTDAFSKGAKRVIEKYTSNLFSSIIIGTILTILMDSSSAVIILVIVFINSKNLTFKQAIGIIMGANIGTTISSQIMALDIGKYSIIPLVLGLLIQIFFKNRTLRQYGNIALYFGMLFFGLFIISSSVLPLKESETLLNWLERVEGYPIQGAFIGGLITLILQSSSATVGMAIILGKQSILSLPAGLAIMIGAELGTCSDTLIATINGRRQALKAGLFHLIFSFLTLVVGLLIFSPFVELVKWISSTNDIGNQIANGHVIFNIAGVLLIIPFLGILERGLNLLLPDR